MSFLKTCLATMISFTLGAMLFHTSPATANPQASGQAHVYIVPIFMADTKAPASQNLAGAKIVGISCIPKPIKSAPDAAVCYVATTLN